MNVRRLKVGKVYAIKGEVPTMPAFDLDGVKHGDTMKVMPKGTAFRVLRIRKERSLPWYEVRICGERRWCNSTALLRDGVSLVRAR